MSQLYQIVFNGKIAAGTPLSEVKIKLGSLFKCGPEQVERLFSGQAIVIKKGLDQATAKKYLAAIKNTGALVGISPPLPGTTASRPAVGGGTSGQRQVVPQATRSAASAKTSANLTANFGLAPVGADVQDSINVPPPAKIDTSDLSLAPVGSDMGQKPKPVAPPPPNTSGLALKN